MIVQGLLILLVVLIVANVGLGYYNQLSPPCLDATEFFNGARKLPDGVSADLGSIPTSNHFDYVGAQTVATGIPGVIGLKSRSYLGNTEAQEGFVNPVVQCVKDDESDATDRIKKENLSKSANDAISAMFPVASQKKSAGKKSSDPNSPSLTEFEIDMEGLQAKNKSKEKLKGKHMSMAFNIATDGYTSRPDDKA